MLVCDRQGHTWRGQRPERLINFSGIFVGRGLVVASAVSHAGVHPVIQGHTGVLGDDAAARVALQGAAEAALILAPKGCLLVECVSADIEGRCWRSVEVDDERHRVGVPRCLQDPRPQIDAEEPGSSLLA